MLNARRLYSVWRRLTPNRETVTLYSRQPGADQGSFAGYSVTGSPEKTLSSVGEPGVVRASSRTLTWEFWQEWLDSATAVAPATLPCPTPKIRDVVEDADGVRWVVREVEKKLMGNVFKCRCLRET